MTTNIWLWGRLVAVFWVLHAQGIAQCNCTTCYCNLNTRCNWMFLYFLRKASELQFFRQNGMTTQHWVGWLWGYYQQYFDCCYSSYLYFYHLYITGQNPGKWLTWNICMGYRVRGIEYWVFRSIRYLHQRRYYWGESGGGEGAGGLLNT